MKIKQLSADLIEDLDKQIPNRHPHLEDSERAIWFNAGQRSVVDMLLASQKQNQEDHELPTLLNNNKEP
jgi:peptidoglycan hydrolase CwlO-like protein